MQIILLKQVNNWTLYSSLIEDTFEKSEWKDLRTVLFKVEFGNEENIFNCITKANQFT